MKLRNKKTGEIIETDFELSVAVPDDEKLYGSDTYTQIKGYSSIKELLEDWEDYEEPKEFWFVDSDGEVVETTYITDYDKTNLRKFGNYFETKEEAEKAVEKLKAWKRLRDKGFRFTGCFKDNTINYEFNYESVGRPLDYDEAEEAEQDLAFIFGGEK